MSGFDATFTVRTIRDGFHEVHQKIRELIDGLDAGALNWKPHPEANSIAAMVTHVLGSEREMLAAVRGVRVPRDRPSEFLATADAARLGRLVDDADTWLEEQASRMTGDDLAADRPRGDRPPKPGLEWLVTNYGHAREHLAQMELTKQLYSAR
jgi:DinB family protein